MQAPSFIAANQSTGTSPLPAVAAAAPAWLFTTLLAVDVAWPRILTVSSTTPALPLQAPVQLPYARSLTMGAEVALELQPAGNGTYVAWEWGCDTAIRCADGSPASSCVTPLSLAEPLIIQTSASESGADDNAQPTSYSPRTWQLWSAAPVLSSGFALLGEISKAVRVSPDRFAFLEESATGFSAGLRVAAGEIVSLAVLVPASIRLTGNREYARADAMIELVEVSGSSSAPCTAVVTCSATQARSEFAAAQVAVPVHQAAAKACTVQVAS